VPRLLWASSAAARTRVKPETVAGVEWHAADTCAAGTDRWASEQKAVANANAIFIFFVLRWGFAGSESVQTVCAWGSDSTAMSGTV
jgi:hypothetical protein